MAQELDFPHSELTLVHIEDQTEFLKTDENQVEVLQMLLFVLAANDDIVQINEDEVQFNQ